MAIDAITGNAASAASNAARKDQLGQDQFLQLMIAQLKHQDPTSPMDPADFLGQLAQFGTVTGIQDMQGSLTTLSDALRSSQILGGTNLVGREVLMSTDEAYIGDTGSITGEVQMPQGLSSASLVITDASGQLVRRMPLPTTQGDTAFEWDGTTDQGTRAPAGGDVVSIVATAGGQTGQLQTQLVGRVNSVTIDPSTQNLTLNTNLGSIDLGLVRRVM
jgi:flagellar basal-body rod modification protein FlgD